MNGRIIPWLAILIAISASLPAVRTLRDSAGESFEKSEREVKQGVRAYFAREFDISAF